jgi:hypothetical protein
VWPTAPELARRGEQFAYDRLQDGRRLLLGPQPVTPPTLPASQSCEDLYLRRLALMRGQVDYKPPYTDDPRNRAAVFIGALWTPGFYYLAFSGIQAYVDAQRKPEAQAEIDALRSASAAQRCFVR